MFTDYSYATYYDIEIAYNHGYKAGFSGFSCRPYCWYSDAEYDSYLSGYYDGKEDWYDDYWDEDYYWWW